MAVKWKAPGRFKPGSVLEKINAIRMLRPDGGVSYGGFDFHINLPILHSMLKFPKSALELDTSTLVWIALGRIKEELTPDNVLAAVNRELSARLATREQRYVLLTSISLEASGLPKSFSHGGVALRFLGAQGSPYLVAHKQILEKRRVPISPTPDNYQRLVAEVLAKSTSAAFFKGMQVIDLQRALWCLMGNARFSIDFGAPSIEPINVVRLGGSHTLHMLGGAAARDGLWFEPNFKAAKPHRFDEPAIVTKNARWALRRIQHCKYGPRIVGALVRFVRALDQTDPDSAFVRLWGALESLVTPEVADYDALIRRCAFLFPDSSYHKQVLEHLRDYRNSHLHGGVESGHARTHCFQLQMYFERAAWFFIRNASEFASLNEVNDFLDQPSDPVELRKRLAHAKRAVRFVMPRSTLGEL